MVTLIVRCADAEVTVEGDNPMLLFATAVKSLQGAGYDIRHHLSWRIA